MELKQHYRVEGLEDVRVIRDRQTRMNRDPPLTYGQANLVQDNLVNLDSSDSRPCRRHNHLWNAITPCFTSTGTAPPLVMTRPLRFG
jgi:hypothetical protein